MNAEWPNTADQPVIGGAPLRFFRHDRTGELIFSALVPDNGESHIVYYHADSLEAYRKLGCLDSSPSLHWHTLYDGANNKLEQVDGEILTGPCDYEYGRKSSSPSIVSMVNTVLMDYSDMETPTQYIHEVNGYPGFDGTVTLFDAGPVRDWIYQVAEEMQEHQNSGNEDIS